MNKSNFLKAVMLPATIGVLGLAAAPEVRALELTIENKNPNFNDNNVYVMFENVQGGNVSSKTPYKLSQLPKPVQIGKAFGRIWISLGDRLQNVDAPNFNNPNLADYRLRWDKIEWTIDGSPTQCANLSSADFFSIPFQISGGKTEDGRTVLGWREPTASVFAKLKGLVNNPNADPVVTGNGPGGIVRVISPSTTANPSAYSSFSPYITAMEGKTTNIAGHFYGNPPSDYNFDATIRNESLVLTGKGPSAGHSITVDAEQLPVQGLYKCDPHFTVDGNASWNFAKNDVYCAALRDALAGFNLGFIGSTVINPHTGNPFGAGPSSSWVNTEGKYAYAGAQPSNPTFYNQYANVIQQASDSYGFPFGDTFVHKPLMFLQENKLNITVLPD
jgi:Beta-1,3-glucanase